MALIQTEINSGMSQADIQMKIRENSKRIDERIAQLKAANDEIRKDMERLGYEKKN